MDYLRTHVRVVAALVIRETQARYGSKPGGYVWAILDPAFHVAMMTVIFGAIGRAPMLGTSFPLFFATGYIAFTLYQGMSTYITSAVSANKALLSYPIVSPIDTVVARLILQLVTSVVVAVVIITFADYQTGKFPAVNLAPVVEALAASTILGVGIGMINITLNLRVPLYDKIFGLVNKPMYLISGVFFLPDQMPHPFQDILLMNPLTHIIMMFRTGFYPEYRPMVLDRMYPFEWGFVALFLGLALLSVSARDIRGD